MLKIQASLDQLINTAVQGWNDLEDEMLQKLASGTRKRMLAVIQANGWYTKY